MASRKFVDVHKAQGSAIAEEAIRRIARLYAVEKEARGQPPDKRRQIRQDKAKPILDDLEAWPRTTSKDIRKTPLAGRSAMRSPGAAEALSGSRHIQHRRRSMARLPWAGRTIFLWARGRR